MTCRLKAEEDPLFDPVARLHRYFSLRVYCSFLIKKFRQLSIFLNSEASSSKPTPSYSIALFLFKLLKGNSSIELWKFILGSEENWC